MDIWKPHDSWGGLMITAGALIRELGQKALIESGLTNLSHGRIGVLSFLKQQPMTQADLCRSLSQSAPSMMEMLQRLKKEKLVVSEPDATDRRRVYWKITSAGIKSIDKAQTVFKKTGKKIDQAFAQNKIKKSEIENMKNILRVFIAAAKKE